MNAKLLLDALFPPHCVFCGGVVPAGHTACEECEGKAPRFDDILPVTCYASKEPILCAVPYRYAEGVRGALLQFKFHGKKNYAPHFAGQMTRSIGLNAAGRSFDVVTSVPISKERLKKRGYNQSEILARGIAKHLNIPYAETLVKIRDNPEQHLLDVNKRKLNVIHVYVAKRGFSPRGKNILLIDDIITTGQTLSECCRVLLENGASSVFCAAAAVSGLKG